MPMEIDTKNQSATIIKAEDVPDQAIMICLPMEVAKKKGLDTLYINKSATCNDCGIEVIVEKTINPNATLICMHCLPNRMQGGHA